MKTFLIRLTSAIVGILGIVGLIHFFQEDGLKFLVYLTPILGVRELVRILFTKEDSLLIRTLFVLFSLIVFIATAQAPEHSTLVFATISILFCSASLLREKRFEDLAALSLFQAKGILGFFYVGLLPGLAFRLLELDHGTVWFLGMMAVIFAGDTFAYIFGMLWGKKKLLPNVSPKKTVMGAIGGLLGSALVAVSLRWFISEAPLTGLLLLGLSTGVIAQLGDLFESMLKRVANIKDSGSLMPGHGGILDRIDGILFGAPIFLLGATIIESFL